MPSFELIESETLLEGRAFKIRRDHLKTPDGRMTKFEIIEHGGSVILVPIDTRATCCSCVNTATRRAPTCSNSRQGTRDGDEPFEVCAAREIREETGMEAGNLQKVGEFYLAPGYSTEFMVVYIATDLRLNPLDADEDEFLSVEKIPVGEAIQRAERGDIPDAKSLAALLLAKSQIK
jgi:8-oxo-dGTP pyrophosphatase MutT (NUDIX family)